LRAHEASSSRNIPWCISGGSSLCDGYPVRFIAPATTRIRYCKRETRPSKERAVWDWVTHDAAGFFTLWLVIVGGVQIGLFYWQLRLIRIAADDAREPASLQSAPPMPPLHPSIWREIPQKDNAGLCNGQRSNAD